MASDKTNVKSPKIALGQSVQYVGTKGLPKAALVVGTPDSVVEGHALPLLSEGQLHLAVWEFSQTGFTPRLNVPFQALIEGNIEFQNDAGVPTGFWKLS